MTRLYPYVGPEEIRRRVTAWRTGTHIHSAADVVAWADAAGLRRTCGATLPATYVIDADGHLLVADRHSEHVACAAGGPVRSAGEMYFAIDDNGRASVAEVSNQSTGYCPEPESWPAVAAALDHAGIPHPGGFTRACVFRRCGACGSTNVVKDDWYACDVCGAALPQGWNFDRG